MIRRFPRVQQLIWTGAKEVEVRVTVIIIDGDDDDDDDDGDDDDDDGDDDHYIVSSKPLNLMSSDGQGPQLQADVSSCIMGKRTSNRVQFSLS